MSFRVVEAPQGLNPPFDANGDAFRVRNPLDKVGILATVLSTSGSVLAADVLVALSTGATVISHEGAGSASEVFNLPTVAEFVKLYPGLQDKHCLNLDFINTGTQSYTLTCGSGGSGTVVSDAVSGTISTSRRVLLEFVASASTVDGYNIYKQ